jgi:hypothetical protein
VRIHSALPSPSINHCDCPECCVHSPGSGERTNGPPCTRMSVQSAFFPPPSGHLSARRTAAAGGTRSVCVWAGWRLARLAGLSTPIGSGGWFQSRRDTVYNYAHSCDGRAGRRTVSLLPPFLPDSASTSVRPSVRPSVRVWRGKAGTGRGGRQNQVYTYLHVLVRDGWMDGLGCARLDSRADVRAGRQLSPVADRWTADDINRSRRMRRTVHIYDGQIAD